MFDANHYLYLCIITLLFKSFGINIISGVQAKKEHFKTYCFVYKQRQSGLFCYNIFVNSIFHSLVIGYLRGILIKTSLLKINCLLFTIHNCTNDSSNRTSASNKVPLNIKTNYLINN